MVKEGAAEDGKTAYFTTPTSPFTIHYSQFTTYLFALSPSSGFPALAGRKASHLAVLGPGR